MAGRFVVRGALEPKGEAATWREKDKRVEFQGIFLGRYAPEVPDVR